MLQLSYCVCLFIIISLFSCSFAVSSQCYVCHGEYCNDPFNKDRATVTSCSNSANFVNGRSEGKSGSLATAENFGDWKSLEDKLWNAFSNLFGSTEYVCAKSSYFNSVHQINMTIRRCMPKSYKGMEACTYLSNIINSGYGKVRSCSFCDTDLCNSAINMRNSLLTLLVVSILKIMF